MCYYITVTSAALKLHTYLTSSDNYVIILKVLTSLPNTLEH